MLFFKILNRIISFCIKNCYLVLYRRYLTIGKKAFFNSGFVFNILGKNSSIVIGDDFYARRNVIILSENGKITIGKKVFFNNNCSLNSLGTICIGDGSIFGENVKIYDHNHIYDNGKKIYNSGFKIGFVKIGNNCWIGSNVTILRNVEIGDNVIIGANCLIYKSIKSNTIIMQKSDYIVRDNIIQIEN